MKGLLLLAVLGSALLGAACQSPSAREFADLILLNGVVYTVDPAQPWAQAVGVKDGRILAVGSSEEIQVLAGEKTEVIDLKGAMVLPGFIDAHTHFLNGGFALADIQLRDAGSREEFIARIRAHVDQIEKGSGSSMGTGTTLGSILRNCRHGSGSTTSHSTLPCA